MRLGSADSSHRSRNKIPRQSIGAEFLRLSISGHANVGPTGEHMLKNLPFPRFKDAQFYASTLSPGRFLSIPGGTLYEGRWGQGVGES